MRHYTYTIHIEPADEGGFVVTVPALPGCITEGDTYQQAIANAHEAIEGFIEAALSQKPANQFPKKAEPTQPFDALVQIQAPAAA